MRTLSISMQVLFCGAECGPGLRGAGAVVALVWGAPFVGCTKTDPTGTYSSSGVVLRTLQSVGAVFTPTGTNINPPGTYFTTSLVLRNAAVLFVLARARLNKFAVTVKVRFELSK